MKTVLQLNSRIKHRHMNSRSLARSHKSTTRKWMTLHSKELCDREQTIMSLIISHWWLYCQDTLSHTHTHTLTLLQYCSKNSIHNKSTAALFHTTIGPHHQLNAIQIRLHVYTFSQSYSFTPCATQKKIFISVLHNSVVCCFIICIGLNVYITIVNHDLVDRKYYAKYAWLAHCLSVRRIAHSKLIDCKCVV